MLQEIAWQVVLAALTAGGGVLFFAFRWAWQKARPVLASLDDLPGLIAQVADVAAEVKMNSGASLKDAVIRVERRLAHLDSRQWALLQDVEHAILESDVDGALVKMNRTYLRWTGRAPSELLGSGWRNAVHPNDVDAVVTAWTAAVKGVRDVELSFRLIDVGTGMAHPVRAHCFVIHPGGGWVCNIYRLQHDHVQSTVREQL